MTGQTLMRRLLPRAAARAVLVGAPEHRASAALIFDRPREGQVVFEAIDWNDRRHRLFYEANRPFVSEHSPLEDALTEDPVQVMFTGRLRRRCARLFDGLAAGRDRRTMRRARSPSPSTSIATSRSSTSCRPAAPRGPRCAGWAERQGLPASEVMAIGRQPERPGDAGVRRHAGRDGETRSTP